MLRAVRVRFLLLFKFNQPSKHSAVMFFVVGDGLGGAMSRFVAITRFWSVPE